MMISKPIVGGVLISLLFVGTGCGQKGALVLPNEPAAQNRASLPQVLRPAGASAPAPAASAPAR